MGITPGTTETLETLMTTWQLPAPWV